MMSGLLDVVKKTSKLMDASAIELKYSFSSLSGRLILVALLPSLLGSPGRKINSPIIVNRKSIISNMMSMVDIASTVLKMALKNFFIVRAFMIRNVGRR